MSKKTVKILLADDHFVVRQGLKQILSDEYSQAEFGEAENAEGIFHKIKEKKWDILILDINMPGRSGLETLKQLKADKVDIPVLVLSMHPEEQVAIRVLKSGGSGYLSKDAADVELVGAVNRILNGKKYLSPSVAEQLATEVGDPSDKAPHELLSHREFQTLIHIASGKAVSQVAEALSLNVATISTYRARILEKMRMKNNAELTTYAIKNDLV